MNYILILCTINDIEKAKEISNFLLKGNLIACANIIPNLTSMYIWQGKICEDAEYLMVLKSRNDKFEEIKTKITDLHPYEVAEIISIDIKDGNKPYLNWLDSCLK